jgi:thiamine kinase-like enzyme
MLLIDWEYSAMAEPMWDLADFSAEADLDSDAMARLLEAYGGDTSAFGRARLALWRIALDLLAAAWAQLRLRRAPSAELAAMLAHRRRRAADALGGGEYGRLLEGVAP